MPTKLETFNQSQLKKDLPDIRPGDIVRVFQKISESKEGTKKDQKGKAQIFEGQVLARKHGKEAGATILVRKIFQGIGIERTFPLHSPMVEKIEVVKRGKVRRAKLYYLRGAKGRKARLKRGEAVPTPPEEKVEEPLEASETTEALEGSNEEVKTE